MKAKLYEFILCIARSSQLMTTDFVRVLFLTDIQNFKQSTQIRGISGSGAGVLSNVSLLCSYRTDSALKMCIMNVAYNFILHRFGSYFATNELLRFLPRATKKEWQKSFKTIPTHDVTVLYIELFLLLHSMYLHRYRSLEVFYGNAQKNEMKKNEENVIKLAMSIYLINIDANTNEKSAADDYAGKYHSVSLSLNHFSTYI